MRTRLRICAVAAAALAAGCGNDHRNGGAVQVTASGEALVLGGYGFPPAAMGDPAFADGWEVRFTKLLAVFDKVTLSEAPDSSPTDPSRTGKLVAEVDGPWVVDLHRGGPLVGKGGADEQAVAIATIPDQNRNGDAPFDSTVRYAFGFDSVPATAGAKLVNVDAADPDLAAMVQHGWNVLYVGTATWRGTDGGNPCAQTGGPAGQAALDALPKQVTFRFGFTTPTSYVNCQNPDNDPAEPFAGEEHQRGVQVKDNATATAQVTFHVDHPFWESFLHDSPPHFDAFAAAAKKQTDGSYLVTLDDAMGVNYAAFTAGGMPLPWRACAPGYQPPNMNPQMGFDSLSIPFNPAGDPSLVMRDYRDYVAYDQSTQGHLNSDGLCFVQRRYPSPP